MPRKKIFMFLAAVSWVVVLAFGPKTMAPQHKSDGEVKSANSNTESQTEDKPNKADLEPAADPEPDEQGSDTDNLPPTEINETSTPKPEPPINEVPEHVILPEPVPPSYPPVCGGCGYFETKNNMTIRCPMFESSRGMACFL